MNRFKRIAALLAALLGGVALGYWWARPTMQPDTAPSAAGGDAAAPGRAERRILYWHDPMVPGQRFDQPGKSPFMDMQLVPVYANEAGGGAAVRIPSSVTQNLGVRVGKAEKILLRPRLDAVGSVAFDERLLAQVAARVDGYVKNLHVRTPLERVRRGQPLADIVAPQWLEAQEEYLSLLDSQSEHGRAVRDAARQRLIVLGVPESTIRSIETDRRTRATTALVAPIDGVVTELGVREGASFASGAPLFRINGMKTVWINAQVPEAQVSAIPMGSTVEAHATAWPGVRFMGRVEALLPDVDLQTRTLRVRAVFDNPDFRLSPGMFVSLAFVAMPGEPQLAVPSEAVITTGARSVVIVAREAGGFDVADVTVGVEADGMTAILSGLEEGQSIVLSGQFLIDSEASLRSTVSRLEEAGAAEPKP